MVNQLFWTNLKQLNTTSKVVTHDALPLWNSIVSPLEHNIELHNEVNVLGI
jgi:hypothetical protein